jgi:hypothetical protein
MLITLMKKDILRKDKNIMKAILLIAMISALFKTSQAENTVDNGKIISSPKPTIRLITNTEIGIPKRECRGFGFGCLFNFDILGGTVRTNPSHFEATLLDSKNLSFTFYVPAIEFENDFLVEDISKNLFQKHAKAFDCSFLELIPGTYKTSKLSDGRINVVLKVNSR